jgi:hypothetical protein
MEAALKRARDLYFRQHAELYSIKGPKRPDLAQRRSHALGVLQHVVAHEMIRPYVRIDRHAGSPGDARLQRAKVPDAADLQRGPLLSEEVGEGRERPDRSCESKPYPLGVAAIFETKIQSRSSRATPRKSRM